MKSRSKPSATKALPFLLGLMCSVLSVHAQSIFDDFHRADTGTTTTGTDIGPDYIISTAQLDANGGSTAAWAISGNQATISPGSISQNVLVTRAVNVRNGLGVGFTASCDLSSSSTGFMGLALNYQDLNDFYAMRIKPGSSTIQLCYVQTVVNNLTDNFNRADTGLTTSGATIGTGYAITTPALSGNSGTASWKISGNHLTSAPGSNVSDTLVYTALETKNTDGFGSNIAATMTTASSGAYMGVVMNYQDKDDFYALRISPGSSSIQLIAVQNSGGTVTSTLVSSATLSHKSTLGTQSLAIATGHSYYMRVASGSAGVFTYTVIDQTTNFTAAGTLQDASPKFQNGNAGVYSSLAAADFDDLTVNSSGVATDVIDSATLTDLAGSTLTVTAGNSYTLTVSSDAVGAFAYILQDRTASKTAKGTLSDGSARFKGGYCGLYATLAAANFQSLSVSESDSAVTDNFNRTSTGATTTGSDIGAGYVISTPALAGNSGVSSWEITGNELAANPGTNLSNTMVNTRATVVSGSGHCFTVSGSLYSSSTAYMGLVANYSDANDFYAIRVKPASSTIELIYVQDPSGAVSSGVCDSATLTNAASSTVTVAASTYYTLSVYSDSPGVFTYTLTNGSATARGTLTDSSARFVGGMAGFYASAASATFDNLSITTDNVTYGDDYARPNVSATTSGGAIGAGYVISTPALSGSSGTAGWAISSGLLTVTPTSTTSSSTLVRMAEAEAPVAGEDYIVSGTVIPPGGGWAGIALNYQDANNYYAVRVQGGTTNLQLIYVQQSGGTTSLSLAQGVTLPFTVTGGTNVLITVTSTSAGSFSYDVVNGSNHATGTLADGSGRFSGGYSGYYAGSAATSSFGPITTTVTRQKVDTQYLSDPTLQAGVMAQNVYSKPVLNLGPLQSTTANGTPAWTFSEYNYVASLYPGTPTTQGDGSKLWSVDFTAPSSTMYSPVKQLTLAPTGTTAASNYDFKIRVNSFADFDSTFKTSTQPWPAAYFGQRIAAPGGTLNRSNPTLADLKKLELSVTAAIPLQAVDYGTGYDPDKHVAHFLLFVTVQNLNKNSAGYGDYMWFGIQLYNDHVDPTTLVTLVDTGTGKYIYNVGVAPFVSANVGSGGSSAYKTVSGDILPLIKQALQSIWSTAYLSSSKDLADYQIGSYSIAWEVTGLADVEAAVKDQSLIGTW